MSQNLEARIRRLQPQLPLLVADPDEVAPVDAVPVDQDRDWQLDEHTRRVGRRGIAAARAHLRSAAGRAA
ncbi:MAG TPA: hypothetical protein VF320_07575 [Acidimicrobiales bacterium]